VIFGKGMAAVEKTCIIFCHFECTVNVIVRSPNSRDASLIVTEPLLEVRSELIDDGGICGLLVDL